MSESNVQDGLILFHLQEIAAAERDKETAVGKLRSARKLAKGDGVSLKTLDAVRHLAKFGEHELTSDFNDLVRYAKLLQVPLYSQLEMFEAPDPDENSAIKKAMAQGLRAGRMGDSGATNPNDPGSPAGQAWMSGWSKGQEDLLSAIKAIGDRPAPTQAANEAPKKRGRPPKEKPPAETAH